MIVFRRARKFLDTKKAAIKGLVYASAGTGKSWLVAKSPKPLIISTERNGLASIAHSNPDAIVVEVENATQLWEVILDAKDSKLTAHDEDGNEVEIEFETLVIDSLTEAQNILKDQILIDAKRDEFILKDWNTLTNTMKKFVRLLRSLPCHVICTCLMESFNDDSTGKRHVQPLFEGKKTVQQISQYFNFVGYLYKKDGGNGVTSDLTPRFLMLDGPDNFMCKPCHPVVGVIENPSIAQILSDIQGTEGKVTSKVSEEEVENTKASKKPTRRRRRNHNKGEQ